MKKSNMRRTVTVVTVAILLLALHQPGIAQQVVRGPYLQVGTPTSIVVKWQTDAGTNSRVRYGTTQGNLDLSADDGAVITEHEVELTGLSPETKYYYAIGDTAVTLAGDDADHFFITAPTPGPPKPTRVWIIGDSGTADNNARAVRDAYHQLAGDRYTDVWLMLGDNAYNDGTDAQYQRAVFDMYPELLRQTAVWPTLGNHDARSARSANESGVYYNIFTLPRAAEAGGLTSGTEAYYSFDYANIHFVCLDSHDSPRGPGDAMLTWLESDLASTTQEWVIAFFHHPPYTKGSHDSDNAGDSAGRLRDMRENALPILEEAGVDLVLSGHSHSYERSFLLNGHYGRSLDLEPEMVVDRGDGSTLGTGAYIKNLIGLNANEGAVYAVAGSSGKTGGGSLNHPVMVSSLRVLGSMVLDIDGNRMDALFLDNNGAVRDEFTIRKDRIVPVTRRGDMLPTAWGQVKQSKLHQNYPNPFNPETWIPYELASDSEVTISIYDMTGRIVRQLPLGKKPAGSYMSSEHAVYWDGNNEAGEHVASGTYFYTIRAGEFADARKMSILK